MAGPSESRELHGRHTAGMLSQSPAFIERVTWTPTRLHDEREEALRRLLRVAIDKSPWHARRLKGVDPARFRVGDLTALPPMTKADLMDHSTRSSPTTDTTGRCWTGISPRSPPTPTYWAATTESHRGDPVVNGECSSTTGMPGSASTCPCSGSSSGTGIRTRAWRCRPSGGRRCRVACVAHVLCVGPDVLQPGHRNLQLPGDPAAGAHRRRAQPVAAHRPAGLRVDAASTCR